MPLSITAACPMAESEAMGALLILLLGFPHFGLLQTSLSDFSLVIILLRTPGSPEVLFMSGSDLTGGYSHHLHAEVSSVGKNEILGDDLLCIRDSTYYEGKLVSLRSESE